MEQEGIRKTQIGELLLQSRHKLLSDVVLIVKGRELMPLRIASVPAHRADIDHPIPKLHKRAPHNRQVQLRNILQAKLDEPLVLLLAQPAYKARALERDAHAEGGEAIFGEAVVEEGGDGDSVGAELLLLLGEIGAPDVANRHFLPEGGEGLEHFGGDTLGKYAVSIALNIGGAP
jgi:hypothetical protein